MWFSLTLSDTISWAVNSVVILLAYAYGLCSVVVWVRMAPIGSHIWMLGPHEWKGLECVTMLKEVSLGVGFGVSSVYTRPSLSLPACLLLPVESECRALSYHSTRCLLACFLPWWSWTGLVFWNCKQGPNEMLPFISVALAMVSVTAIEPCCVVA